MRGKTWGCHKDKVKKIKILLTKHGLHDTIFKVRSRTQAAIAQSVVRNIGNVEVTSSILVSSFGEGAPGGVLFSIAIVYGIW